ncbi:hypothetical protein CYY_006803 [Polysphondylium violaceum]|uniref:DNA helicase n=1 Tax=Polysphondylium violaceum TaxID=133409 RepID=A0A8J4PYY6_9MYCE|nr:hypothetical protein CYY_006803 [Polysphondylium violaceum]
MKHIEEQSQKLKIDEDIVIPKVDEFVGWPLYFPLKTISELSVELNPSNIKTQDELLDELNQKRYNFIKLAYPYFVVVCKGGLHEPDENNTIPLDYITLQSKIFKKQDNFEQMIKNEPELVLDCIGVILFQLLYKNVESPFLPKKKINIRLFNYEPLTSYKKIKANLIGKFVSIKGTVIRRSPVRPMVTDMQFICLKCSQPTYKYFNQGLVEIPSFCSYKGCTGSKFEPDRTNSHCIDWQKIRLQEIVDQRDSYGGIPKTIDCEFSDDLVELVSPGDSVTVSGIVKKLPIIDRQAHQQGLFEIVVEVNSVSTSKQARAVGKAQQDVFSIKDMYAIREIATQPNLFKLITNSICPSIYGHEMVKAGLALVLFGGNTKRCQPNAQQKKKISTRPDAHVLIVGDPGMGKSQMLNAIHDLAPRGVYVSGGVSTSSGLTVSVLRDSTGEFYLEAGALVLADRGICCIDEFDKMPNEHCALLETMEQQSVSVAKAGIVCNLPARTSVIAAANPVGGHYNRAKSVAENVKMSSPLLSRFDLIFILIDKPDSGMDKLISDHIIEMHSDNSKKRKKPVPTPQTHNNTQPNSTNDSTQGIPLQQRLIMKQGELDLLPQNLLRKYISYAKKYVSPVLTMEASKVIQDFYLKLRDESSSDSMPVTTRQLESLIRLSEARAKLELRETVTENDAKDIIEIIKQSLYDVYQDDKGTIDFRKTTGKVSVAKTVFSMITKESSKQNKNEFTRNELLQLFQQYKFPVDKFDEQISTLNNQGMILKIAGGKYRVMVN